MKVGDQLLVVETLPGSNLADEIESGELLTVERIVFDDDDFESGYVIVVTENNGWIHAHGVADLMEEDKLVVSSS